MPPLAGIRKGACSKDFQLISDIHNRCTQGHTSKVPLILIAVGGFVKCRS